jgi:hypothetical protein
MATAVSAVSAPAIAELIARTRGGDPAAASALADLVETRLVELEARAQGSQRHRGGEPAWRARQRIERDSALRDLAQLLGADLSLDQQAALLISKITRYCPMPEESIAERRAVQRVVEAGLRTPGRRQLRRILAMQSDALNGQKPVPPSS